MANRAPGVPDFEDIASNLELLASVSRLEILHALRSPKALHEIRVGASRSVKDENPHRLISRQAIRRHLGLLQEAGLVETTKDPDGGGERFALSHERVFALVDEMRGLARIRRVGARNPTAGETMDAGADWELAQVPRPRVMLAYGRDEGTAFPLAGGGAAGWRIGRAPSCEMALDYDPFLSAVHCRILQGPEGFEVADEGSRNGTWLNWKRLDKQQRARLQPGDLLMVGRSVLTFQP